MVVVWHFCFEISDHFGNTPEQQVLVNLPEITSTILSSVICLAIVSSIVPGCEKERGCQLLLGCHSLGFHTVHTSPWCVIISLHLTSLQYCIPPFPSLRFIHRGCHIVCLLTGIAHYSKLCIRFMNINQSVPTELVSYVLTTERGHSDTEREHSGTERGHCSNGRKNGGKLRSFVG